MNTTKIIIAIFIKIMVTIIVKIIITIIIIRGQADVSGQEYNAPPSSQFLRQRSDHRGAFHTALDLHGSYYREAHCLAH